MCNTSVKIASTATPKELFLVLCALPRPFVIVLFGEFTLAEEHGNCTIVQLHYENVSLFLLLAAKMIAFLRKTFPSCTGICDHIGHIASACPLK